MGSTLIYTVSVLCLLGIVSAIVLHFVARAFRVDEDPRQGVVEGMLPGANCGGCGFPGCKGMAGELVRCEEISHLNCPVGGAATMNAIAQYLGKTATVKEPQIAVIRCDGSCAKRPRTNLFDGASSCAVEAALYGGETACTFGCLGQGDCVSACNFGALHMNPETGLPQVDEALCTACGACVKKCPRHLIELRKRGVKGRRIYVACANMERGAVARKGCVAACIGCGKCLKTCQFGAITVENHLAYIDDQKCRLCRKCVAVCPVGGITEVNFPARTASSGMTATPPVSASACSDGGLQN